MKFLAIFLTIALLGVMAWVTMDSRSKAKEWRNRAELANRQAGLAPEDVPPPTPDELAMAAREARLVDQQVGSRVNAAPPTPPGRLPGNIPPSINPPDPVPGSVPSPATAPPMPLTAQQRQVQAAPPLGKVSDYDHSWGIVVLNVNPNWKLETGMTFALRRGHAVVGKVKITEVQTDGITAELQPNSVPPGITVQVGDDVIQDMPAGG